MRFSQLREIFIFTSKERNGTLLLLCLLFITLLLHRLLPLLIPEKEFDTTAWRKEAGQFYAGMAKGKEQKMIVFEGTINPNSPDSAVLAALGIPEKVAANWVKYLKKGGYFGKKTEVLKLYGMTPELYAKVERYLVIKTNQAPADQRKRLAGRVDRAVSTTGKREPLPAGSSFPEQKHPLLELNETDSVQLEALPGIGPVLASRIIRYRRLLGGYYEVAQLKEVYGMTDELWQKSSPFLTADPAAIQRIELNFLSVAEMGRHPYIGFRQAKRIIKRRDSQGKFTGTEALALLFTPDSLQRLLPYLLTGGSNP